MGWAEEVDIIEGAIELLKGRQKILMRNINVIIYKGLKISNASFLQNIIISDDIWDKIN